MWGMFRFASNETDDMDAATVGGVTAVIIAIVVVIVATRRSRNRLNNPDD